MQNQYCQELVDTKNKIKYRSCVTEILDTRSAGRERPKFVAPDFIIILGSATIALKMIDHLPKKNLL